MSSSVHQVRYTAVGQDGHQAGMHYAIPDGYKDNGTVEVTLRKASQDVEQSALRRTTSILHKVVIGLVIVVGIAVSWVSVTQFVTSTYSETFVGPFFTTWFATSWMIVCYPVHLVGTMVISKKKRKGGLRNCTSPFTLLWAAVNYMYARSLSLIQPADVTAIFTTNTAFVYVGSWIWLSERLVLLPAKSISVMLSMVGTILICYADGFGSTSIIGVVLVLGSAIGAALYKVFFKKYMPANTTYGQVSLFLSVLGWLNLMFLWPVMLILYYLEVEMWDWQNMPWVFLNGCAALTVVFNFLTNYGIAVTFPLFIALGNLIGLPLNAATDWVFRNIPYGWPKIGGTILIIIGFVIMLLPEPWQQRITCWKEGSCPCETTLDSYKTDGNWDRLEGNTPFDQNKSDSIS